MTSANPDTVHKNKDEDENESERALASYADPYNRFASEATATMRQGLLAHTGAERSFPNKISLRPTTRRQAVQALMATGLACLLVPAMMGCGTGFTHGGIPEGRSVIVGRVVASDNPQKPISNAAVTVYNTPSGEDTVAYRVLTDVQGNFSVTGIATGQHPTGTAPTSSNVTVSVSPNLTQYLPQQISFRLTENRPASVLLAVPPTGFDYSKVGGVKVTVITDTTTPPPAGTPIALTAQVIDHSGQPLISSVTNQVYVPNLILDDLTLTTVGNNGYFEVTGSIEGFTTITGSVTIPGSLPSVNSNPVTVPIAHKQLNQTGGP